VENIQWKLRQYLETHGLSAYALAKVAGGRETTIYRLAREGQEPDRVDLPTLARVIGALRKLTGETVTPNDLLEVIEEIPDQEQAWLDSSAADLAADLAELEKDIPPEELKAWNEAFEKQAEPVVYDTKRRVWLSGNAATKHANRKVVTQ
jgi:transcriptional regulator with XRE-family HTH domain